MLLPMGVMALERVPTLGIFEKLKNEKSVNTWRFTDKMCHSLKASIVLTILEGFEYLQDGEEPSSRYAVVSLSLAKTMLD